MELVTAAELTDAMVSAARPSIKAFAAAHAAEQIVGLAVETLAEMRYFHLAAETASHCRMSQELRPYLETSYLLPEDISSNCQEWRYFDFNSNCEVWTEQWAPMEERISEYDRSLKTLGPDERVVAWEELTHTFWRASVAALARLLDSEEVRSLPKGSCFVTFIYEHHDVF
ncbi:hypothetical protein Pla8534_47770 [Lignipirellula cremea]|uniref:DUF4303 domain-containing protein n=2 Tax=Lignipirellula cremea TaxID=2528010 RepID=A0A518DYN0_9BACT|nr:hypothetical protein Pla8534_47770 [Lignipirellula cremea]